MQPEEKYLTVKEFAKKIGVSKRTTYRWHALRVGPARCKIGRKAIYRVSAVEAWLKATEIHPTRKFGGQSID